MKSDYIDKDTLRPGDKVGIKIPTRLGWGYFRYQKLHVMTIERITPARTKFVMKNGAEFGKDEPFYPITEEAQNESYVTECAENISRCLGTLEQLRRDGKFYTLDDEFIVTTSELLKKICESAVR